MLSHQFLHAHQLFQIDWEHHAQMEVAHNRKEKMEDGNFEADGNTK